MAAFFRGLILFLFGAIVGAAGILFFTPSFNVVVSRSSGAAKPVELVPAPAPVAPPVAAKAAEPAAPVTAATVAAPTPAAESAAEPAIDFKSVAEHLVLWPTTVTVKAPSTVPVTSDGKKVQDLALEAGTVLQLSKVLADGTLEVRAKGAKFEIKSTLTDFSVELGKRVADLVAKGTKVDASVVGSAPVAAAPVATPAAPAPATPVAVSVIPSGKLTLAQRVDILFGNKPEAPVAPAAPAAPAAANSAAPAPAAPVAEAVPAASAEQKAAEKGKDLDRKMNQLFR